MRQRGFCRFQSVDASQLSVGRVEVLGQVPVNFVQVCPWHTIAPNYSHSTHKYTRFCIRRHGFIGIPEPNVKCALHHLSSLSRRNRSLNKVTWCLQGSCKCLRFESRSELNSEELLPPRPSSFVDCRSTNRRAVA